MDTQDTRTVTDFWRNDEEVSRVASEHLGVPVHVTHYRADHKTGPCPFCKDLPFGATEDGFIVWERGNYNCRKCTEAGRPRAKGWWLPDHLKPDGWNEQYTQHKQEVREATAKAAYAELQSPDSIAEIMSYTQNSQRYDIWMTWGFTEEEINRHGLGYCTSSPTAPDIPTVTIPVLLNNKFIDVRHRILAEEQIEGGKYRSHLPGLKPFFYNADVAVSARTLHVVEGEKKAIILKRAVGPNTIAYPGIEILPIWPKLFDYVRKQVNYLPFQNVIFYPDPGTVDAVARTGYEIARLGIRVSLVHLPDKPDDMILNSSPTDFMSETRFNLITL